MLNFRNDYGTGAHPVVLEALCRTNLEVSAGYGLDPWCDAAAETIRRLCAAPEAAVHLLVGGTQANKTAIAALLRPYEAVIAAESGHICTHETGAIEQCGHKIIHCPSTDGKLRPEDLTAAAETHFSEHMVRPRLAYISNTTELGTVYRREELTALRAACDSLGLLLYCDGARLGSAMAAGDTRFSDYAAACHAFTIGGTKNGLLFGEALVFPNGTLCPEFRFHMKQLGAMLAKGRLLGVQFEAILTDGLYLRLAQHANTLAQRLSRGLIVLGLPLLTAQESNQVFPILPSAVVQELSSICTFESWQTMEDGRACIRLVTGWSSTEEDVDTLLERLRMLLA